ncbi:glycosyltransferase family 2 protein [Photobacterium leiognathi]|uniref:Glycosyltransferase family 2 protein n=1 Tax=Photobacterium leiognathi TaxID=553611 RepID=A0A2T3MFX1_PHOLE|nr:glycosyltransferase family 2 protein [Photobacterium leiognathi]KJF97824.1 hypothetical protein UB34_10660 [Photobacterium leiognathi]PSV92864.1 glycosyltransferase family 2 protein [Photobacterium leiognathi]
MSQYSNVSVIIPFYNAADTIKLTINSILEQSLKPLEVIIVNDASDHKHTKKLELLLSEIKCDIQFYYYKLKVNRGAAFCRNYAISKSSGDYLAFLDADDVWFKRKLELQYNFMIDNGFRLSGHGYIFNVNEYDIEDENTFSFSIIKKYKFLYKNPFFTPTVMVKKDSFHLFDNSLRRVDDYKCWIENFEDGKVALINVNLAGGFKHPIGVSGLTGSIYKMHKSYLLVLQMLLAEKKISSLFYIAAKLIETVKYPLRCFKMFIKRYI